jgi:hypothetical protein
MHRSMRSSRIAPILAAIATSALGLGLPAACGGAQAINLGGSDSGGGGGGGSGGGSGSGSSSGTSGGSGSGSGSSSGGSGGGSGSSSGSAEDSGSGVMDSSSDDVTPVEEPMPTGPSVLCPMNANPATCEPGDYCCVVGNAMQGNQTDNCQTGGSSCAGTPVRCASPADCPNGQICCGTEQTVDNVVSYIQVVCADTCSLTTQRIFCDQSGINTCPVTAPTCALSTLMPGYNVCQQ